MKFLDACRIAAMSDKKNGRDVLVAMSGTPGQLELFLRAHAAGRGLNLAPRFLEFGTLGQAVAQPLVNSAELFLLLPWDLVPQADWRSGVVTAPPDFNAVLADARRVMKTIAMRKPLACAYLPASLPPMFGRAHQESAMDGALRALAAEYGAFILPSECFGLATFLNSGCPVAGTSVSAIAERLIAALLKDPARSMAKILVTDLDETLWSGLAAEKGACGVSAAPEGRTYGHFLYQTLLRSLKARGVLLAAVSRNDEEVALAPLRQQSMVLSEEDFVAVRAGYGHKSDLIKGLAQDLNLGLDSFVFVDDNPVEIVEVSGALPAVASLAFPPRLEDLPGFFAELSDHFQGGGETTEDMQRTEMYRRRFTTAAPKEGVDLDSFLKSLGMRLRIREPSIHQRTRAHQLINKTNQFNLNGVRIDEVDMADVLAAGGRLFVADLTDRSGSHGEIIAFLVDVSGIVRSFVMSCRVFQRRVEYSFLCWLARNWSGPQLVFDYRTSERNAPARMFFDESAFSANADGLLSFDAKVFLGAHEQAAALVSIETDAEVQVA